MSKAKLATNLLGRKAQVNDFTAATLTRWRDLVGPPSPHDGLVDQDGIPNTAEIVSVFREDGETYLTLSVKRGRFEAMIDNVRLNQVELVVS